MTNKAFRAARGLDAAQNNIINVADPRANEMLDGVNQGYFIQENTVQVHDSSRAYNAGFIVSYLNRLWAAQEAIPAGPFDATKWKTVRTDPAWIEMSPVTDTNANAGDYIHANTTNTQFAITLPVNPQIGDMIVVNDRSGEADLRPVTIERNGEPINGVASDYLFNIPSATLYLYYTAANTWITSLSYVPRQRLITVSQATEGTPYRLASFESVYARTSGGKFWLELPEFPNDGDVVTMYDLDEKNKINYTQLTARGAGITIDTLAGTVTTIESNLSGRITLVYESAGKIWRSYSSDIRTRTKTVKNDILAEPMDHYFIDHSVNEDITLTLPEKPFEGNWIDVTDVIPTATSTVTIQLHPNAAATTRIRGQISNVLKQKYSDLEDPNNRVEATSIVIPAGQHGVKFRIHYDMSVDRWVVGYVDYRIEHVDENNRSRPGIIPLATQAETNKQDYAPDGKAESPDKDKAVTPELLDGRRSTETLAGLARIATDAEVQVATSGTHRDDVIVTPEKLNARQATQSIRGVAEVATQTETRSLTNDTHIITPKKFHAAQAEEELTGVAKLVTQGGIQRSTRGNSGTGVFESGNHTKIVTPKMLDEYRASETQPGTLWTATQSEANAEAEATPSDDAIITPKKLANRRASEVLRGIVRQATTAEANAITGSGEAWSNVFITPKTLHERQALETRRGVAEIATQAETDAGTDDARIITPEKFKTWLDRDHFTTTPVDGLSHSGNIWGGTTFSIALATETQRGTLEVATQSEANAQGVAASDAHIITPEKLDSRRATESQTGIARLATNAEIDAGTATNEIVVTPSDLTRWTRTSPNARSTTTRYGTVRSSLNSESWIGNTTDGSTQCYTSYSNTLSVTPQSMNYALENYLPKTAKAVDSDKLDNLDSTQFARSDVDDVIGGKYTFTDNEIEIQGVSPRIKLAESDQSGHAWYLIQDAGNISLREDGTGLVRFEIENDAGGTKFTGGSGVVYVNHGAAATDGVRLDVMGAIEENESAGNVDGAYGSYTSPATGKLREKYLGINNVAKAAVKLVTARTIALSGDASGSISFDGTSNETITVTVADNSHNHSGENITTGTINSARTVQANHGVRGTVALTADRTGQSTTLAISQKGLYDMDQVLQNAVQNRGTANHVTFTEYVQVGSVRMEENNGIVEFTYNH